MTATVEFYEQVLSAFPDAESLTVVTVAGMTRDDVLAQLGADLSDPVPDGWDDDEESTAWAAIDVPGGVVAVELTGYGDPSRADLAALSRQGAAAVVRSNIQAHYRFGCAEGGDLVFDDDEYVYVSDRSQVPHRLRALFDAAWVDLDEGEDDEADPLATGLAMAEVVTGVTIAGEQVASLLESGFYRAPSQRYPDADSADAEPRLVIPEGEAGLAAAARIGRDVEGDPGARTLSGNVGSVTVERTIRGTRRKLFGKFAYLTTWSHAWTPGASWSFSSGALGYELDSPTWAYSSDNVDQLTGRNGAVRWSFAEVDKPARAVRRWNWMRPQGDENATWADNPLLDPESTLTVSLTESKRDGEPWTTIRIEHAGLPVEWLADMETYWAYQLSIADIAEFGTSR